MIYIYILFYTFRITILKNAGSEQDVSAGAGSCIQYKAEVK